MYERRAAAGEDIEGEARFLHRLAPGASVLVAGCGTGRIPRQLAARGHPVAGFDVDPEMVEVARRRAPELRWERHEVTVVDLGAAFDVVVMPGNLLLFLEPSRVPAAVANMARHVAPGGYLVAGFALRPGGPTVNGYDALCLDSGLVLVERWATWQRAPFSAASDFAVSVHRRTAR